MVRPVRLLALLLLGCEPAPTSQDPTMDLAVNTTPDLAKLLSKPDLATIDMALPPGQWTWRNVVPNGNNLTGMFGASANAVYVVGLGGTILHTTDGGVTWVNLTSGTTNHLLGIWGPVVNDLYAVGDAGTILHSSNGAQWQPRQSGVTGRLNAIWGSGATNMFIVGDGGLVLRSIDNGQTWSKQTSNTTRNLMSVWGASATDVWAVGENGTILHTTNAGVTWTATKRWQVDLRIDVGGLPGTMQYSYRVDGGAYSLPATSPGQNPTIPHFPINFSIANTWGVLRIPNSTYVANEIYTFHLQNGDNVVTQTGSGPKPSVDSSFYGVWGVGASDVHIVGATRSPNAPPLSITQPLSLRTTDGGSTWTYKRTTTGIGYASSFTSIWGDGSTKLYAAGLRYELLAGSSVEIWKSTDSGANWTPTWAAGPRMDDVRDVGFPLPFRAAVWGKDGAVYAMGPQAVIGRSDNDAGTWALQIPGARDTFAGVYAPTATEVFLGGRNGTIAHSTDGGISWSKKSLPGPISAIIGTGAGEVWAAGGYAPYLNLASVIHYSTDNGVSYSSRLGNIPNAGFTGIGIAGIWGLRSDRMWVVGRGVIYVSSDKGINWISQYNQAVMPNQLQDIWGISETNLYAVGEGGTILHSENGTTWNTQTSCTNKILYNVWGPAANDIYAVGGDLYGGTNGVICHSSDGGATWQTQTLASTPIHGIWGSAANDIYVGNESGTIFHTTNQGATWDVQPTGNVNYIIAMGGTGPRNVFAVGINGTVLQFH